MCATSALVHTACTPDNSSAVPASIDLIFPCAAGERTTRIVHWPGNEMSAAKSPWPKIKGRSSRRITERPTNFCTALIIMASVAYPGQTFICLVLGNAIANSRLGENDPRVIRVLLDPLVDAARPAALA